MTIVHPYERESFQYRDLTIECEPATTVGFEFGAAAIDQALQVYPGLAESGISPEFRVFDSISGGLNTFSGFVQGRIIYIPVRWRDRLPFRSGESIRETVHHEFSSLVFRDGMSASLAYYWSRCLPPKFSYASAEFKSYAEVKEWCRAVASGWRRDGRTLAEQGFTRVTALRSMEEDFNRIAASWFSGSEARRTELQRDTLILYKLGIMHEVYDAVGLGKVSLPRVDIPRPPSDE